MTRKYVLHDGKRGSALALRITPRASRNQIVGVMNDGTVKVHIAANPDDDDGNLELIAYLSEVLGVPKSRIEIVAGEKGRGKLGSVLGMGAPTAPQRNLGDMD